MKRELMLSLFVNVIALINLTLLIVLIGLIFYDKQLIENKIGVIVFFTSVFIFMVCEIYSQVIFNKYDIEKNHPVNASFVIYFYLKKCIK